VIILRDKNNKLTPTQQNTILTLNSILGKLIFTSDYIADYSEEQFAEYLSTRKWVNSKVKSVLEKNGYYVIDFVHEGKPYFAFSNLWKNAAKVKEGEMSFTLEAYETMIMKK